ncbi:MAG: hypothetical protein A2133_05995 [Actinobacteria bacterium RBG_16_64_13]|nr:MAG: hypothetical protein A2133_05995 [Actinobacteria bacterium RBG_16_64_13]
MASYDPADFETLYPGVYTAREAELVEKRIAENRALEERGQVDVKALIEGRLAEDIPGVGPTLEVTEAMVRYNNKKYDPENRLLNDREYARALGHPDILAMPCYGAHDDTFIVPYPPEARDTLLVSQLGHGITSCRPVYPGDKLYLVADRRRMADRTPAEGSIYRRISLESAGSVYNQRGEKVNDVVFRASESLKIFKEGKRPEKMGFRELWEAPDWMARPAHYYTDDDWGFIKGVWAKEQPRDGEPLYWEDVRVGEQPNWTADGPIEASVAPTAPYGMGAGGSRTLKKEILDPELSKTLIRGEKDGIYRTPAREDHVPPVPDGAVPFFMIDPDTGDGAVDTQNIHQETEDRAVLINFLGRDLAVRHVNNWMGHNGWLQSIRWGIMPPEAMAAAGKPVPANPWLEAFLEKVPHMRGKTCTVHGLTGDLALVKSYVYDKYHCDGAFYVELAWWIETIEGDIWLNGGATVKLPSRRAGAATTGGRL